MMLSLSYIHDFDCTMRQICTCTLIVVANE